MIPIGLAEAAALAIGAVRPPALALTLVAVFTLAHVAGKLGWYWLGTRADLVTERSPRSYEFIKRAREVLARYPAFGLGVLAASAVASVPPFHVAAIAAGVTRIPFVSFLLVCLAGRLVRFALIASVPALVRTLFA